MTASAAWRPESMAHWIDATLSYSPHRNRLGRSCAGMEVGLETGGICMGRVCRIRYSFISEMDLTGLPRYTIHVKIISKPVLECQVETDTGSGHKRDAHLCRGTLCSAQCSRRLYPTDHWIEGFHAGSLSRTKRTTGSTRG